MDYSNPKQSGRDAFLAGKSINENPCDRRTHANHSVHWHDGWLEQSKIPTCKGKNCTAIRGVGHSEECTKDHEACYANID